MTDYFEWNDDLTMGEEMDLQHQFLLEQINLLLGYIMEKRPCEDLRPVLKRLIRYALRHFHEEETLMEKTNYPNYPLHRDSHDRMFDQLLEMSYLCGRHNLQAAMLTTFLMDWWMSHIQVEDLQLKNFLAQQGFLEPHVVLSSTSHSS